MTAQTYVYGITDQAQEGALNILGADGVSPVHVVAADGLGCVVSDHAAEELQALPKERLLRALLGHQRVVESVMKSATVLPVQFGTLLEDPSQARDLLHQGHALFDQALASLRGSVELEVVGTWDVDSALRVMGQEPEIAQASKALSLHTTPTVEERVQLGRLVKSLLDRRRASYRGQVLDLLQPLALDWVDNALVAEAMVANVAFLVDRPRLSAFEDAVRSLDHLLGGQLSLRIVGPLPPYSFSTVHLTPLPHASLREACHRLGLEAPTSEQEVKAAFRRRLGEAHASSKEEAPLRQAYDLLLRYCKGQPQDVSLPLRDGPGAQTLFTIEIRRARGTVSEPGTEAPLEPLLAQAG